jgi:nucleoside-diphosphate-sugar epimerase
MNILITGAKGFIGQSLCPFLQQTNHHVETVSLRTASEVDNIQLEHYDAVIHLAALAHQMRRVSDEAYMESNYELTRALANKAKSEGIKKFVFISSVKVYGETSSAEALNELSICAPQDIYGKSKLFAEQYLQSLADERFQIVILRLPLVYGPHVKGNFLSLLHWHAQRRLIPFKHVTTQRAMVYVGNVCAMIASLLQYAGKQQCFVAADDVESMTLHQLSQLLLQALHRRKKVFFCAFPSPLRWLVKHLKPAVHQRLFDDFKFNADLSFNELRYTPAFSIKQGIEKTCNWYLTRNNESSSIHA